MSIDTDLTVGQRIRRRRRALDLTGAELGARLGCPKQRISAVERGAETPSPEWIARCAEALGVAPTDLDPTLARFARRTKC